MISYPHFIFASALGLVAGAAMLLLGLRFLLAYSKDKKNRDPLFIGIFVFSLCWLFICFFLRALPSPKHDLTLTAIGLGGFCLTFPFGSTFALSLTGIKKWKIASLCLFLLSFATLGLLIWDVLTKVGSMKQIIEMGVGLYVFDSIKLLEVLIGVIILLIVGFFFYLAKISSGFLRKKGLTLAIGSLLLLFLLPDLVGYGTDFLGIWRVGELGGCITMYYGFTRGWHGV